MFKDQNCDDTALQLNRTTLELNECKGTMNNTILQLGATITQLRDTIGEVCEVADCTKPKAKQLCHSTCEDGMLLSYQFPISFCVLLYTQSFLY